MGMFWRRRSSWLKIVVVLVALWLTVTVFFYSEERDTPLIHPEALQQHESDSKLGTKNKFKDFIDDSYKDANKGALDKLKRPIEEYVEVNEVDNEIDEPEKEVEEVVEIKPKKQTTKAAKKPPSKKKNVMVVDAADGEFSHWIL